MNALALLAAGSLHGLLLLIVYVIVAMIALGIVWAVVSWLAAEFGLPGWVPIAVLGIVVILVLLWLAGET